MYVTGGFLTLFPCTVQLFARPTDSDMHGLVFVLFESTPPCDAVSTLFKTSAGLLALGSLLGAKCMLPEREISAD